MNEPTFTLRGSDRHGALLLALLHALRRLDGEADSEVETRAVQFADYYHAEGGEKLAGLRALSHGLALLATGSARITITPQPDGSHTVDAHPHA